MDTNLLILLFVFALIALVLLVNLLKVFVNLFTHKVSSDTLEEDPFVHEVHLEIEKKIRPHMNSLEGIYHKSASEEKTLSDFVFSVSQEQLSELIQKDEAVVQKEIEKYCSAYENAECKESFCLEGSGISCGKV